jgi:hypothetical protein
MLEFLRGRDARVLAAALDSREPARWLTNYRPLFQASADLNPGSRDTTE